MFVPASRSRGWSGVAPGRLRKGQRDTSRQNRKSLLCYTRGGPGFQERKVKVLGPILRSCLGVRSLPLPPETGEIPGACGDWGGGLRGLLLIGTILGGGYRGEEAQGSAPGSPGTGDLPPVCLPTNLCISPGLLFLLYFLE